MILSNVLLLLSSSSREVASSALSFIKVSRARHARQHCRDNLTLFSGHIVDVGYCFRTIFFVATPLRHGDETFFEFFSVAEALLRCRRIVIVAKQENCHVPSSAL